MARYCAAMPQSIDTLRAFYDAIHRRDYDDAVQYLHPGVELHPAVGGEMDVRRRYRGRNEVRQFMDTWEGFEVTIEPEEIIEAPGDRILVVERWHFRGRQGIEVDIEVTEIWTFRDGLIARIHGCRDRAEALEAAGLRE
jgi:ketosteroid isomerase-like protein